MFLFFPRQNPWVHVELGDFCLYVNGLFTQKRLLKGTISSISQVSWACFCHSSASMFPIPTLKHPAFTSSSGLLHFVT